MKWLRLIALMTFAWVTFAWVAGCVVRTLPPALPADLAHVPPPGLPNGVAAGDVTQESVVLWARAATSGVVTFTVQTEDGCEFGEQLTRTVIDPLLPVTVTVSGLAPGTRYEYAAEVASGERVSGTFRTPAEGGYAGLRFAATGDVRGDLAPYPSVANMSDRDLDFFVHLGDSVYADIASPTVPKPARSAEEFLLKHNETHTSYAGLNTLAALRGSTVTFATIDDHEIVNNFAGGAPANSNRFFAEETGAEETGLINETRLYGAGLDAFLAYQPLAIERYGADAAASMVGRPKLYRYRTFGLDAALFVLDMRSFRDAALPRVTNLDDAATIAQFEQKSFDPNRTLLGATQMADLQRDLLDAQSRGITWKFIVVPDPMQYLDMTAAADRWQGYAAERTALLRFLVEAGIENVVFITADIHGTVVNNLMVQEAAGGPHLPVAAWEIAVGPVAAHPPFGLAMFLTYLEWGIVGDEEQAAYNALPIRHDADSVPDDRDDYVRALIDEQMARYGYNALGLADAEGMIDVSWVQGDAMAGHVYGWSEFDIDAGSQALTVTTYGIPAYVATQMASEGEAILAQTPQIVSEFVVQAQQPR